MGSTFKDFLTELAPPWLRQVQGEAFLRALGDVKDALAQRHKDGVKARLPGYTSAAGLAAIGAERGIVRTSTDTNATFAARLVDAWAAWYWAGTATGILRALRDVGYSTAHLVTGSGRDYSLDGSGNLVTVVNGTQSLDLGPPGWSSFIVYFPSLPTAWGGVVPHHHSDAANLIRRTVKRWKSAQAKFAWILIVTSGPVLGLPFTLTLGTGTLGGTVLAVWGAEEGLVLGYPPTQTLGGGLYLGLPPSSP